jgi:membrane protein YqaA with SNARE-associated domain
LAAECPTRSPLVGLSLGFPTKLIGHSFASPGASSPSKTTRALGFLTYQHLENSSQRGGERSRWILPAVMFVSTALCVVIAALRPEWARLLYLVPYTFLGNSLAPLPYDGAVVYLGSRFSLFLIVSVALLATLIIEMWNMELLTWILAREGTSAFRNHRVTLWTLRWYRKAPFCSLVATCVLPLVPHYPMRFLAVMAGYPLWKYQMSVVLGRGTRYALLAGVGVIVPIPGPLLLIASILALALGVRGFSRMNRSTSGAAVASHSSGSTSVIGEEA